MTALELGIPSVGVDVVGDIRTLLADRGRAEAAAAIAHLSVFGTGSCIGAYDPDGRITPLIEFLPLPIRGADLLDEIAGIDENAPRLVAHFSEAFPDATRVLSGIGAELDDLETPALGWLLLASRTVLSLDGSSVDAVADESVKVDTAVIEEDGRYLFDGRRLLRSLMSYRIAEVTPAALALSVSESMGDFVSDAIGRLLQEWPDAQTVACAGDLFTGDPVLRSRAHQGLGLLGRLALFPRPAGDAQPA